MSTGKVTLVAGAVALSVFLSAAATDGATPSARESPPLSVLPGSTQAPAPMSADRPDDSETPGLAWVRGVDASGEPVFADAQPEIISIDSGSGALVVHVRDASGNDRLWHSTDGTTWSLLPSLPGIDSETRIDGVVGHRRGWVAYGIDATRQNVIWVSPDGSDWERVPDSDLQPRFRRARLSSVIAGRSGLFGLERSADPGATQRIWVSRNGRKWRGNDRFADAHAGAAIRSMGVMGDTVVSFGRDRRGRAAAWVGTDDQRYVARQIRGSTPAGPFESVELHVGRAAGLAIVRFGDPGRAPESWHSINGWDWRLSSTEALRVGSLHSAFASDGTLILSDRVIADGDHSFSASTDGKAWLPLASSGDVPTTVRTPNLLVRTDGVFLVAADGIWYGSWVDRSAAIPPRVEYAMPAVGEFGADPELRPPVRNPKAARPVLDTRRPPSARTERRGVRLEHWVPDGPLKKGQWLAAHVRITNTGSQSITFICGGAFTQAKTAELFPPGRSWTGNAAEFKKRVLDREWPGNLSFSRRRGDGDDCPGSVGLEITLAPGSVYEYSEWTVPRYPIAKQPLPSGRLPVQTIFGYEPAGGGEPRKLYARSDVRIVGPQWKWATPQDMLDAMIEDPRFGAWLEQRYRPGWWDNPTFEIVNKRSFYWTQLGFDGPAPDGTVHIGLFAGSWNRVGGYGRALLDPWTATVLGVAP